MVFPSLSSRASVRLPSPHRPHVEQISPAKNMRFLFVGSHFCAWACFRQRLDNNTSQHLAVLPLPSGSSDPCRTREVRGRLARYLCGRSKAVLGNCPGAQTTSPSRPEGRRRGDALRLLGRAPESRTAVDQMASRERAALLALGGVRPRLRPALCIGPKEEPAAAYPNRLRAHKAEVVHPCP